MTSSRSVTQYLPALRRYALAVTGRQAAADAVVAATLEAALEAPEALDHARDRRVALYRLFTEVWSGGAGRTAGSPAHERPAVERHLGQLQPRPRQAFLLTSLEGFSDEEAAEILDIEGAGLRDLLEQAGHELADEIATDVLIIEDEAFIALHLEKLVSGLGHRVVGVARTHAAAVTIAKLHPPGLILADIHLADASSGLDAVNEVLESFSAPVIFITAYPKRFLAGERPEPALLITKPFQPNAVAAAISQALLFERNARRGERRALA